MTLDQIVDNGTYSTSELFQVLKGIKYVDPKTGKEKILPHTYPWLYRMEAKKKIQSRLVGRDRIYSGYYIKRLVESLLNELAK